MTTVTHEITGISPDIRILFLALCYSPEEVSGAVLITELAEDLATRGHDVTIVTTAPSYPLGTVLPPYKNRLLQQEIINGVRVIRVWSYISTGKDFLQRMLHQATFCFFAFFGSLAAPGADVIFSYSPPLPLGFTAWFSSLLRRIPWILQLEDIFPQAAISTGVIKNPSTISFFSSMERFLYRHATRISVISKGFTRNLIAKGVPEQKIDMIPVWADCEQIKPMKKENEFTLENGFGGKFVVMYAGNLGLSSCPEVILQAAISLLKEEDIVFAIVGEGVKKDAFLQSTVELGLSNIRFLPFQPRALYPQMLAAADLHLVMLNEQSSETSMPSKTFNIMSAGRPVLLIAPLSSEAAHLVIVNGCGMVIPPGEGELLAEEILHLKECPQLAIEMGKNGRSQLETEYSRSQCIRKHEDILVRVVTSRKVTE
jgi:colanic acid biosynthesis glycosyl transferase WcaI